MWFFGPQTMAILKELGQRFAQASGDERSTTYLFQRLSVKYVHLNPTHARWKKAQVMTITTN